MPRFVTGRLPAARERLAAHPRWRWMALVVVASGMWLSVVNVSIVNIALPDAASDLGVDVPSIGWVVTGFLVTQATLLPIAGRAGDLYGRRRVFAIGVGVLCLGSVLCALAWDAPTLIAFRIVQGIGASAMAPTAFSYVAAIFPPKDRGQAMGVLGGVIGLAPVVALNIAGVLVAAFGWRSVFWFTPPVAAVVLAGAALILPESRRHGAGQRFDLVGAGLAATGLFALLLAISKGETWGVGSPRILAAALVGVVALGAFVRHEARTPQPMLDLNLFRLRSLTTANLAAMASSAALFGVLILLPFYLTRDLGFGAQLIGLGITPIALSFVVVAPLAGRAMGRVGSARMASAGFAVSAAGAVGMALAAPAQSYLALLPGIVAFGVGLAMATSPITTTAIEDVPALRLGVASALPNISRYTGGALGAAILGAIMHAALPEGVERTSGKAGPYWSELVAGGFRTALIVAAAFLVCAAAIASRMPRLGHLAGVGPLPGAAVPE